MQEEYLEESKSSETKSIKNYAANMYSHLMKCVAYDKMSSGWIGTIFEGCRGIQENEKFIRKVVEDWPKSFKYIKDHAIKIYIKDDNSNAEAMFNYVYSDFRTIYDLKNYQKVKQYLLNIATKNKDFDSIDTLNTKY